MNERRVDFQRELEVLLGQYGDLWENVDDRMVTGWFLIVASSAIQGGHFIGWASPKGQPKHATIGKLTMVNDDMRDLCTADDDSETF